MTERQASEALYAPSGNAMPEIENTDIPPMTSPDRRDAKFRKIARQAYDLLASVKLALALLIAILVCCIIGVVVIRNDLRAWSLIFSTLWFNSLLVLLVVNVGFCFFGRIWGRRVTLVSFGMILFHLSFIAIFGGIVFNSLFYFRGLIRLTEGETLPAGELRSYDYAERGRFFDMRKLTGQTTLIKMHYNYKVEGVNKRAAYEIAVGEGRDRKQGIIYLTKTLDHNGFQYINDREGYSLLITLQDKRGRELYGAHISLQGLKQKDDTYLFTTGTRTVARSFPYPQEPLQPLYALQVQYLPSQLKERAGDVVFQVWPFHQEGPRQDEKPIKKGKALIGERYDAGNHYLSAAEVRYWVVMSVRYEPGKPVVLTSLWVGLGGMIITFVGRMRRRS